MTDQENDQRRPGGERLERGQLYRLAWAVYLVLAVGGVVWIGLRLGAIPLELFVDPATMALDVGLGLGAAALLVGVWALARRTTPAARRLEEELRGLLGPLDTSEVVALALLSGFAEELFFRGAFQGALGWPLATVAFALLHTGPGRAFRIWTLFALVAGLLFAGLVEWRQTLTAAIVAHVGVNLVNLRHLAASEGGDDEETADRPDPGGDVR
ncbi:MAG: CPBP family intramembrane glutamic endopeptidase [Thermoanaerobaculia bacterium]|nr:CPBP family intramembrane glutamic endopeptidase [Thermoanaerobaculia bacterium]